VAASPGELLHDLFGSGPCSLAAARHLSGRVPSLHRARPDVHEWTTTTCPADRRERPWVSTRTRNGPTATTRSRTYGHIVVDEVQDLTPMQLRMVSRRSLNGSMTVVGDIAQARGVGPELAGSRHLPDRPARGPGSRRHHPWPNMAWLPGAGVADPDLPRPLHP
jgi:hypothetical protein